VHGIIINAPYRVVFWGISFNIKYESIVDIINSKYRYGAVAVTSIIEKAFNIK
jgi:hypothetical protein